MNESELAIVGRLGWALLLGGIVGAEREYRGNEAGLRTSALVCLGAAMFGEVARELDAPRVAAGVVQGIGFLGAGLMFREAGQVQNATTAVTMWVLAGVGIAAASGLWISAGVVAIGLLVILELAPVSNRIGSLGAARSRNRAGRVDLDARSGSPRDPAACEESVAAERTDGA